MIEKLFCNHCVPDMQSMQRQEHEKCMKKSAIKQAAICAYS